MSAWLFDLGNTRLKCAPLREDGRCGDVLAISHQDTDVAAALARLLPARFDVAYLASVAGDALRVRVLDALATHCGRITIARTQAGCGELRIAYRDPRRLGVDRFLAMLGAHEEAPGPVLVCGIGTALTVDLVDRHGLHRGGRIAPSPTLMREALHWRAPHLPLGGGDYREFADDTCDALVAGCHGAALGLIEHSLAAGARELGETPSLCLHGGGSEALLPWLPDARWRPKLVLDGLANWAGVEFPH